MASIGQINPDVPSTAQTPDTYLYISTAPTSISVDQPKDLFLVATGILSGSQITSAPYSLTPGTATPNEIKQYTDVARVNAAFGRKSPVANRFRSAMQEVPIGINLHVAAISEPSNSGYAGMATRLLTFAGTASGSGQITLRAAGHECQVPVANGDVASTIAAAAKSAVDKYLLDAPVVTGSVIDLNNPVITIATNATGSNFTITANGVSKVVAITAMWTPPQSATAIAAALAGDASYPLTATSNAGVVTASWRAGFLPSSVSILGADATQTYALTYTAGGSSGATLPLLYVTRGADGNDLPVLIEVPPEVTGVSVSPGSIAVTTNALGASGSPSLFVLQDDSTVYPVAIPVGTTPAQAAALIAASINSTTGPLSASAAGNQVALYYRSGWYTKKLQVSSTEDATGQTYSLVDRHNAAGSITSVTTTAGNPALTGLSGAGVPNLTALLSNASKKGFSEWSVDYLDSTSTSAIYAHTELYSNGFYQQNLRITFVSTDPLETAKTVATSATPQLGNSWRYSVGVAQGAACSGGAYSAQVGARLCATDLPFNMDGMQLTSGGIAPMLPGRSETDLTPTSEDVALGTYHLFPIKGINGVVTVTRGKTTWTASNTEWSDWSYGRTFDAVRYGMRAFLNRRFRGRVLFRGGGTVRVPNGFTSQDVKDAIGEYLDSIDGVICDGARDLKKYIAVEPSRTDAGFLRIFFRERPPRELHIISGVVAAAA